MIAQRNSTRGDRLSSTRLITNSSSTPMRGKSTGSPYLSLLQIEARIPISSSVTKRSRPIITLKTFFAYVSTRNIICKNSNFHGATFSASQLPLFLSGSTTLLAWSKFL